MNLAAMPTMDTIFDSAPNIEINNKKSTSHASFVADFQSLLSSEEGAGQAEQLSRSDVMYLAAIEQLKELDSEVLQAIFDQDADFLNLLEGIEKVEGNEQEIVNLLQSLLVMEEELKATDRQTLAKLTDMLAQLKEEEDRAALTITYNPFNMAEIRNDSDVIIEQIQQLAMKLKQILQSAQEHISANSNETTREFKQLSATLLTLLKDAAALEKQGVEVKLNAVLAEELSDKELTIFKQLSEVHNKRSQLLQNGHYQSNATITNTDVSNWLQQAFNNYAEPIIATTQTSNNSQGVVMTEAEQYVIHTASTERVEEVSDRLIKQFTNIMRTSQFMTQRNELTIMLRPEHLGNMTVKLEQVNGEMIVRILVSSLATKGILETNVDQLKHMFLPHQVIIEKDELIIEEQLVTEHQEEEELEENDSSHEDNKDKKSDEQNHNIDFQTILQQVNNVGDGSE